MTIDTGLVLLDVSSHPAHPRLKEACARYYRHRTKRDARKDFAGLNLASETFGKPARSLVEWVRKDAKLASPFGLLDYALLRVVGPWYRGNVATRAAWIMATLEGPLETEGNDEGPIIRELQRTGDLPPYAWPWCAITVYAALLAAGWTHAEAFRKASSEAWVEAWDQAARAGKFGLRVVSPATAAGTPSMRSCLILFRFDAGTIEDHIGITLGFPDLMRWLAPTVEGNTSAGAFGSQADGGGVFRRTRPLGSTDGVRLGTTLIALG